MDKHALRNFFRPIIIFFIAINALCISCGKWLDAKNIDHIVLMYANLILFILTLIACYIHVKALRNDNAYAFVRSVTLASFLKLIVIGAGVFIYFMNAENKSLYAIAAAMVFYIVYTIFEVKGAMKLNRERNAKN